MGVTAAGIGPSSINEISFVTTGDDTRDIKDGEIISASLWRCVIIASASRAVSSSSLPASIDDQQDRGPRGRNS